MHAMERDDDKPTADEAEQGDALEEASLERTPAIAKLHERFDALRSKILANDELSGDKAITRKLDSVSPCLKSTTPSRTRTRPSLPSLLPCSHALHDAATCLWL